MGIGELLLSIAMGVIGLLILWQVADAVIDRFKR